MRKQIETKERAMTQPPQDPNQPYGQQPQQPYGQQPPQQPYGQPQGQFGPPPGGYQSTQQPAPIQKKTKKWPWIVGGVVVVLVIAGLVGGGDKETDEKTASTATSTVAIAAVAPQVTTKAAAPTTTVEPVVVTEVALPEVSGQNGAIVQDKLEKLGLTNVTLASVDENDTVVIMVANWTAVSIEPAPGTIVAGDDLVVVTMTKK